MASEAIKAWEREQFEKAGVPFVMPVADVQESEAEWLIDETIPAGQITIIGGDGGTGKGFLTCNILAGLTTGKPCLLDMQMDRAGMNDFSNYHVRDPKTVLYLSGEDTFEITIRRRLRKAGADLSKILTMNFSTQLDEGITTDSTALEKVIEAFQPDLLVLDPLESFIGDSVRMGDRNSMRQALKPLLKYGEKYGLTTLLIAHANKGKGVWGRKRLADSSDLWDHARSVFLTGWTPDNKRYISHEKSNYHEKTKTIEFEIVDETVQFCSYSDWTDKEYVLAGAWESQGKSSRSDAKDFIIDTLKQNDEPLPVKELDELAAAIGYNVKGTLRRAKAELKEEKKLNIFAKGYGKDKQYFAELVQ